MKKSIKFNLEDPKNVYSYINRELANLVQELSFKSNDEALSQAQAEAHSVLGQRQSALQKQIAELETHAEWNTFTIAFYGETGAGKSTLIETLRILLQEPSKAASQKAFRALRENHEGLKQSQHELQEAIAQKQTRLSELTQHLVEKQQEHERLQNEKLAEINHEKGRRAGQLQLLQQQLEQCEQEYQAVMVELGRLQEQENARKRTVSFWQKLLNLFKNEPENKELALVQANWSEKKQAAEDAAVKLDAQQQQESPNIQTLTEQLAVVGAEYDQESALLLSQQKEVQAKQEGLLRQQQEQGHQMASVLLEMESYADGEIIGDGRSDFTRQTQRYDLSLNGQDFALLDVPGIEGKEGLVLEEIERAVQKAHAVFYVTNQAAPPQTGDEQTQGTLEKIKAHLGAQTEVWSVFNKKINNVKYSLLGRPLLSTDEAESLKGLNEKMREQLGGHYRDAFALTARPAFLAATDHFVPDSKEDKDRAKTLAECAANELLDISQMNAFLRLLDTQLLQGSKAKIRRANFNKVGEALAQVCADLDKEQAKFSELSRKISSDAESAISQLDISVNALQKHLDTEVENAVTHFSSQVRNRMYFIVEKDVDKTELKSLFEQVIQDEQRQLSEALPKQFEKKIEGFQSSVSEIFQRFHTQAKELSEMYVGLNQTKLDGGLGFSAIEIDNGVKVGSLLLTLVGGVLAVMGTGGWILAIGLVGVAFSLYKSIKGYFDSDYKKSQQRQFINKGLRSVVDKLKESLKENLKQIRPEMDEKIAQIKQAINEPSKQTAVVAIALTEASERVDDLFIQVNEAGK